jgi:aryl-alcohol dehydrogenase-like predicted oxidoreductase
MRNRRIGDIEVSALGLGCASIAGAWDFMDGPAGYGEVDDEESVRAIHRALDRGISFFDTAPNYGCGRSERVLGKALAGRQEDVVIATKFGYLCREGTQRVVDSDVSPEAIRHSLHSSLRRLRRDTVDLFQLHVWYLDLQEALEVRQALEELVAEGKIRSYGWSTDDPERIRVFAQDSDHCVAVQHQLNVIEDVPEVLAVCDEFDLASINLAPLMSGFLSGKYTDDSSFPENDWRRRFKLNEGPQAALFRHLEALREVLTQEDRTLVQGALGWIWARSERTIPIPGFKTVAQVEETAQAMEFGPLSSAQMREIDGILGRGEATGT